MRHVAAWGAAGGRGVDERGGGAIGVALRRAPLLRCAALQGALRGCGPDYLPRQLLHQLGPLGHALHPLLIPRTPPTLLRRDIAGRRQPGPHGRRRRRDMAGGGGVGAAAVLGRAPRVRVRVGAGRGEEGPGPARGRLGICGRLATRGGGRRQGA